jgi:amino acid transporter
VALAGLLLLSVGIPLIRGTDFALKINTVLWLVGMASVTIMAVALLVTSQHSFVGKFNAEAGSAHAYANVIATARASGFSTMSSASMIWPLVAVMVPSVGWCFWMTYIGGEVRRAGAFKRQMQMMFYPLLVSAVGLLTLAFGVIKTFGYHFMISYFYLVLNDPSKLPHDVASGGPIFLAGLVMGGNWLAALFVITFLAWVWPSLVIGVLMPVRATIAWSMDLVFPESITRVSPRLHTPVRATVLIVLIMFGIVIYSTGTDVVVKLYAVSIVQAAICSWGITGVAAIMFRRKMPELYAQQPIARYGPLLKICGALSILYTLGWSAAYYKYHNQFGMTTWVTVFFVALWVAAYGIFHAIRIYRERQGIPLSAAYQALPPE